MHNEKKFRIGQPVEFNHRGVTRAGVVRGTEFVADPRRQAGWHYVVSTADYEWLDVHADHVRESGSGVMTLDPRDDVWFLLGLAILFATLSVASSLIALNMRHGF